ncbi:MAG TPA: 2OG-Fe(II) oxygenase family protein, partial [Planctomycetaceae bacterium]
FAVERAIGASVADLKEFYQLGRDHGPSAYGPNVWPEEVWAFRESFAELFDRLETLAARIVTACSLYLDRPADFLPSRIAGGESVLRVIQYPPLPADVPPGAIRAAAHEDINFLTLLCGATADGLEIRTRDGRWHPVSARHTQIVVDSGDMLQNLTGGLFRSTTHRVVNPSGPNESRLSMPFFVHPRAEVDLSPLPDLAARAKTGRAFPSLTAGEFLRERLAAIRPAERRETADAP